MSIIHDLKTTFPKFLEWPESAQQAVVEMATEHGVLGLLRLFPNCAEAMSREDWKRAAGLCVRSTSTEGQNARLVEMFRSAAKAFLSASTDTAKPPVSKYLEALERIASLPDRFGHFNGHDAATEAVRIAKEALGIR